MIRRAGGGGKGGGVGGQASVEVGGGLKVHEGWKCVCVETVVLASNAT